MVPITISPSFKQLSCSNVNADSIASVSKSPGGSFAGRPRSAAGGVRGASQRGLNGHAAVPNRPPSSNNYSSLQKSELTIAAAKGTASRSHLVSGKSRAANEVSNSGLFRSRSAPSGGIRRSLSAAGLSQSQTACDQSSLVSGGSPFSELHKSSSIRSDRFKSPSLAVEAKLVERLTQTGGFSHGAGHRVTDMQLQAYSAAWEEIIQCDPAIGPALRVVKDVYDACALPCLPGLFRKHMTTNNATNTSSKNSRQRRDDGPALLSQLAEAEVANQELKAMVSLLGKEIERRRALGSGEKHRPNCFQTDSCVPWSAMTVSQKGVGYARP